MSGYSSSASVPPPSYNSPPPGANAPGYAPAQSAAPYNPASAQQGYAPAPAPIMTAPLNPNAPPAGPAPMSAWQQYCIATEVRPEVQQDLFRALTEDTTVVLMLDDSGSMQTAVRPPGAAAFSAPTGTRWSELQTDTQGIVQLVTAVNPKGIDIHFMNRPGAKGVKDPAQIYPLFTNPPSGGTPMISSIRNMYREYGRVQGRVLLIMVTDGEPSDGDYSDLKNCLLSAPNNFYISFVECNDNEEEMDYLTGWDLQIPRFHNQEDYGEELNLVRRVMGPNAKFTRANYVQMIVLSPIFPQYAIDIRSQGGKRNPFGGGGGGGGGGGYAQPIQGYNQQPQYGYGGGGYPQQGYQQQPYQGGGNCCVIL